MFMQRIRQGTKKHGKLLIVIVVILAVGLVGSFAVWGAGSNTGRQPAEATTAEQIAQYEGYIASNEPAAGAQIDFSTASSMANLYSTLASLCATQAGEETDAAMATQYSDKATDAATKANDYYQIQLDTAPETLNDAGRAQILAGKAAALSYLQQADEAKALYQEVVTLDPTNINYAYSYVYFLYINSGLEEAQAYADTYLALVEEDSEEYKTISNLIGYFALMTANNTPADENTDTDPNAETGDNANTENQ